MGQKRDEAALFEQQPGQPLFPGRDREREPVEADVLDQGGRWFEPGDAPAPRQPPEGVAGRGVDRLAEVHAEQHSQEDSPRNSSRQPRFPA
jgi:hypothetical protein